MTASRFQEAEWPPEVTRPGGGYHDLPWVSWSLFQFSSRKYSVAAMHVPKQNTGCVISCHVNIFFISAICGFVPGWRERNDLCSEEKATVLLMLVMRSVFLHCRISTQPSEQSTSYSISNHNSNHFSSLVLNCRIMLLSLCTILAILKAFWLHR